MLCTSIPKPTLQVTSLLISLPLLELKYRKDLGGETKVKEDHSFESWGKKWKETPLVHSYHPRDFRFHQNHRIP